MAAPETLKNWLDRRLRGYRFICVANREPYIHEHTPEGIRLPERDYRHDVWSLIQAAAVRVTYRAPLDGWEPYTAVYDVEDTQGWSTLYAVQAAPGPGSPPLD